VHKKWIGILFGVLAWAQPVYTVQTAAGSDPLGDGGPATNAVIQNVNVVIADSSGNVYIAENQGRIRRVGTKGIITTVAGQVGVGSGGDGGPAVQAGLNVPLGLAIDTTGNFLYISDYQNCRIRRVALQTGIITTFAGNGTCAAGPDGSTSSSIDYPTSLLIDSQGRLVFSEPFTNRIRRIDTFGTITTIAGNGTAGLTGNGGLATQALITSPGGLT
jgi:sugar lactone lactonase YvrE